MQLELKRMEISNFKGTKSLSLDFSSLETRIFGANSTGKSSIQDALCWLLFNKDSKGNAPGSDKFREKPLNENGTEIHNLNTNVTAEFEEDGAPLMLTRTQTENWVGVRGQTTKSFKGNTSQYWVNDVETKASDFQARVASFAPEDIFRMITSLGAFNALDWKKRRATLISLNQSNVDDALLASDEFSSIREEVLRRNVSVDDLRKVLTDQKKKVNQDLLTLPARIDEAHTLRPAVTDIELSDARYLDKDCSKDIERVDGMIAELAVEDAASAKKAEIAKLEAELFGIRKRIDDAHAERKSAAAKQSAASYSALGSANAVAFQAKMAYDRAKREKEQSETLLKKYREEYSNAKALAYKIGDNVIGVCPTCGQSIPTYQYEAAVNLDKEKFDANRKSLMDEAIKRGSSAKADYEQWSADLERTQSELDKAVAAAEAAKEADDKANAAVAAIPNESGFESDAEYVAVKGKLDALRGESTDNEPAAKRERLLARKRDLEATRARAQETIRKSESMKQFDERIAELEDKQRDLGDKVGQIDTLIMLVERFVTARCGALEDSINDHFPTLRWKLFETQINGGITDTCICMIACGDALVDYNAANTAAQVNADIEIVRVLSEHYNITAPLFVDNAERVNYIARPAGQLITLSVSDDSALRIEHINEKEAYK